MMSRTIAAVLTVLLAVSSWAQSSSDAEKAQTLMQQGAALLDQKQADAAQPILRQATVLAPSTPLAFYFLGSAEMTLGKYTAAQEAMQTALRLDALNPGLLRKQRREAQDILALAFANQKQYAKARAAYEDALAKDPAYPGFSYNLACVCALAGDRPAALAALRTGLANDAKADSGRTLPDPAADEDLKGLWGDPVFLAILVASQGPQPNDGPGGSLAREGARRLSGGDAREGAELLQSSLEVAPAMVRAWFLLGGALEIQGKSEQAAEAYRKALTLNVAPNALLSKPAVRHAALFSGRAFLSAGKPAEAVAALKTGAGADDYYAPLHYEMARAYAALDDKAQARASLKRAAGLAVQLSALDPPLPDPARDAAFAKWARDRDWLEFLSGMND